MEKIYDFKALTSKGKEIDFSEFKGKVLLIVNTASKCYAPTTEPKDFEADVEAMLGQ